MAESVIKYYTLKKYFLIIKSNGKIIKSPFSPIIHFYFPLFKGI